MQLKSEFHLMFFFVNKSNKPIFFLNLIFKIPMIIEIICPFIRCEYFFVVSFQMHFELWFIWITFCSWITFIWPLSGVLHSYVPFQKLRFMSHSTLAQITLMAPSFVIHFMLIRLRLFQKVASTATEHLNFNGHGLVWAFIWLSIIGLLLDISSIHGLWVSVCVASLNILSNSVNPRRYELSSVFEVFDSIKLTACELFGTNVDYY